MRFKIVLSNKDLATKTSTYVDAYCFAEAASQAYLLKNNRNAQAEGAWWKIHSIEDMSSEKLTKKEKAWGWGWSSEGEMT